MSLCPKEREESLVKTLSSRRPFKNVQDYLSGVPQAAHTSEPQHGHAAKDETRSTSPVTLLLLLKPVSALWPCSPARSKAPHFYVVTTVTVISTDPLHIWPAAGSRQEVWSYLRVQHCLLSSQLSVSIWDSALCHRGTQEGLFFFFKVCKWTLTTLLLFSRTTHTCQVLTRFPSSRAAGLQQHSRAYSPDKTFQAP